MVRIRDESSRDPQALKIADDFRESYWWLRDNTPENARILAWWDYGYQISGVANRTTLADGNRGITSTSRFSAARSCSGKGVSRNGTAPRRLRTSLDYKVGRHVW